MADEKQLDIVESFDSYEDYLDSHLTTTDLFYLEVRLMPFFLMNNR